MQRYPGRVLFKLIIGILNTKVLVFVEWIGLNEKFEQKFDEFIKLIERLKFSQGECET